MLKVCKLTVLGAVCVSSLMVASSCSSVERVSGRYSARDSSNREVGMRSSRCSVSHCCNCSRSRCSDTPSARIPRARLAPCSSAMDRFSTPSFTIICADRWTYMKQQNILFIWWGGVGGGEGGHVYSLVCRRSREGRERETGRQTDSKDRKTDAKNQTASNLVTGFQCPVNLIGHIERDSL